MTAVTARTKENGCEFALLKTSLRNPLHTPVRHGMLSSATLNDLTSYSQNNANKHLKFIAAASMNDVRMCSETTITPIRFNKASINTPISTKRRALGLVSHNSNRICRTISIDDLSKLTDSKEIIIPINIVKTNRSTIPIDQCSHPEDDLPHKVHVDQDTFDDLMPANERVERMVADQADGVNFFNHYGGVENTLRCQSRASSQINVSTLLDMVDYLD